MKIEKDVKYEKQVKAPATHWNQKYPWVDMEVGDSVLTNETDINSSAITSARVHASRSGKTFRTMRENGFIRVFRLA